jgi:hypothetical protein
MKDFDLRKRRIVEFENSAAIAAITKTENISQSNEANVEAKKPLSKSAIMLK